MLHPSQGEVQDISARQRCIPAAPTGRSARQQDMEDEGERISLLRGGDGRRGGGKRRGRVPLPTAYPDFSRRDRAPFASSRRIGIVFIGATVLIALALINAIASKLSERDALAAIASRQSGTLLGVQDPSHTVPGYSIEGDAAVGHGLGSVAAGSGGTVDEGRDDGRQRPSNSVEGKPSLPSLHWL